MGRHITNAITVVALCLMFSGCTEVAHSYSRSLHDWSRHKQSYSLDNLRAELIWNAVLLTPEMREARIRRHVELLNMDPAQVERSLPSAWNQSGTNFLVSLYAPKEMQGLVLTDTEAWHVQLLAPTGETMEPVVVEEMNITPLDRKLFPFLTQWSRAFFVRFPAHLAPGPLRLSLHGINARSELTWRLE